MDVSSTTKKWAEEIDKAKTERDKEIEKMNQEFIKEVDNSYTALYVWRANYEQEELTPLRNKTAKINSAKKYIKKWLIEVYII
jgi:single-stranded DNA-specific DHH superfamily exonuclease